jgi:hypothetical protein
MRTFTIAMATITAMGCAMGPSDETVVSELRVLAIQADPPEVAPGEAVDLNITVADPLGAGADVLLWHCTNLGEGCLEEGGEHSWTLPLDGDGVAVTATVPPALAAFASDEPLRATQLWALACEPGLCPQVDDPDAWDLSDPSAWLADLPMSGVSLGSNLLAISTRDDRLVNPELTLAGDGPLEAAPGGQLAIDFAVTLGTPANEATFAFGYATAGGFGATEYAIGDSGEVSLDWYAPDEPSEVTLWVVVNDGAGGVGVWSELVPVR